MPVQPHIFQDLTYIFVAAVAGAFFARRLGFPLILGFVAGGIVISPFTPGPKIHDVATFEELAEVGVVLLMFSIGVEFSFRELLSVKWVAVLGGIIGITASIVLSLAVGRLLGWPLVEAITIGPSIAVCSTMVLVRLLSDRGAINSSYGRIMIGISLIEDLAVVFMVMMLPAFIHPGLKAVEQAGETLGKAVLFLVPLGYLSLLAIPWILRRTQRTKDDEFFLVVAFTICLATAALAHWAGFSTALGAFLAGLSISGARDLHTVHARIVPLRDAFVALFFVSLGTIVRPDILWHCLPLLLEILALIVIGKFVIWGLVVLMFGYSFWIALAAAAGLSQIGELSFVIARAGRNTGLIGEDVFVVTLAASLLSIFINVLLVRTVLEKIGPRLPAEPPKEILIPSIVAIPAP